MTMPYAMVLENNQVIIILIIKRGFLTSLGDSQAFYEMPYVAHVCQKKQITDQKALLIMGSSKPTVQGMYYNHWKVIVCLLFFPANTTDCLQPLDLSINKAAKNLRDKFRQWYANEVSQSSE